MRLFRIRIKRNPQWTKCGVQQLCGFLATLLAGMLSGPAQAQFTPTITLPKTAGEVVISPVGNHVAFMNADQEHGTQLVLDGKPQPALAGKPFEAQVRSPWFDRKAVKGDDRPNYPGLFFSPNGEHLAYAVIRYTGPDGSDLYAGRQAMVIDGVEGKSYGVVSIPFFTPDSRHVAYAAYAGPNWVVVLDGKELGPYDEIGSRKTVDPEVKVIAFSRQGNHLAFTMRKGTEWRVVLDGKEGPAYQGIQNLTFSPDGKRLAYVASTGRRQARMVIDGKEDPQQYMYIGVPIFSPNSKKLGYIAVKTDDMSVAVIDGKEEYSGADRLLFSPDSKRVAVVTNTGGKHPYTLKVDGKEIVTADLILQMRFSPDSRHIACVTSNARTDNARVNDVQVIIDGQATPYQAMGWLPVYSADSSHMAYLASIDGKQAVVVDGKPLPAVHGWIYHLTFSPDNQHIIYQVHPADQLKNVEVVVDGVTIGTCERLLTAQDTGIIGDAPELPRDKQETPFFFDAPDRFRYYTLDGGRIKRVDEFLALRSTKLK